MILTTFETGPQAHTLILTSFELWGEDDPKLSAPIPALLTPQVKIASPGPSAFEKQEGLEIAPPGQNRRGLEGH